MRRNLSESRIRFLRGEHTLPQHLNCNNTEIQHCDFYILRECPQTCAYANDIRGYGVGAVCDNGLFKRLRGLRGEQ